MGLELQMYVLSMCVVDMSGCLAYCVRFLTYKVWNSNVHGAFLHSIWKQKKKNSGAERVLSLDFQSKI
jgi:hypothetical protein